MRTVYAAVVRGQVTGGIWMKCSSRSTDGSIICGVQWTRMATYWIFWSKAEEIRKAAQKFFSQASKRIALCPARDHYRQVEELQRRES